MGFKDIEARRAYHREYQRKRRLTNPEEGREAQRRYYQRHTEEMQARRATPEYREGQRQYQRKRREANPEEAKAYYHAYYETNKEHILARTKEWARANRDKINAAQRERREAKPRKPPTEEQRASIAATQARLHQKRRMAALVHYGGGAARCSCCGEATLEFLTIDHINGDGAEHRRKIGRANLYRWLEKHDYPEGFRTLCIGCNFARGMYGYCPHERQHQAE